MLARFHRLSKRRQGEFFQFAGLGLWALWPVLTVWVNGHIDPLWQAALATLCSVPVFALVLTIQNKWHELGKREAWLPMLFSSLLIGVVFYGLAFTAFRYTTAGNGAIISLVEVLYSFAFFGLVLRHERYTQTALLGTLLTLCGASLVLFQGSFEPRLGDLILLGAFLVTPAGNYFQQQARAHVSSSTVMFVRSVVGGVFLTGLAGTISPTAFSWEVLLVIGLNGLLLLGLSKIFWLEAIHRISVTHANSLGVLLPAITLIFAFMLLGEVPTWWQIAGLVPMLVGAWLILNKDFLKNAKLEMQNNENSG